MMVGAVSRILPWEMVGGPDLIAEKGGGSLASYRFRDPYSGEVKTFTLIGQRDWSVVMAVTENGLVITNHEFKFGCNQILHELVGGQGDFEGEAPEEVMRRELLEETGYEPAEVIFLGPSMWMSANRSPARFHPFLARGCRKIAEPELDENEHIETELVPLDDWVRFCLTGCIEPSAVVTTFRALPHLGYKF